MKRFARWRFSQGCRFSFGGPPPTLLITYNLAHEVGHHVSGKSAKPYSRSDTPSPPVSTLAIHEKDVIEAALRESKGRVSGPFGAARRTVIDAGVEDQAAEDRQAALPVRVATACMPAR
jgi:hypothetical protein